MPTPEPSKTPVTAALLRKMREEGIGGVTACHYGSHAYAFVETVRGDQHLHRCSGCGGTYMRPGANPCWECAPSEAAPDEEATDA